MAESSREPLFRRSSKLNQRVIDVIGVATVACGEFRSSPSKAIILLDPREVAGGIRVGHASSVLRGNAQVKRRAWTART
jgi:hypothetical protein